MNQRVSVGAFARTIIFLLLIVFGVFFKGRMTKNHYLSIAISGSWRSLHPGLQHTAWADMVLVNQFDPLVGIDQDGRIVALGSASWTVSKDLRTYEFLIDTTKRYSDGSYLKAADYKRSWEESLKLDPSSANSSLQDVLYAVDGYGDFRKTGTISGLQVLGDDRLVIHFSKPFRTAFDHLSGSRYAAWKTAADGKFLGTGVYILNSKDEDSIELSLNTYSTLAASAEPIFLYSKSPEDIAKGFSDGTIDVLSNANSSYLDDTLLSNKKLEFVGGDDSAHLALSVNGLEGHLLSNPRLRQALQSIFSEETRKQPALLGPEQFIHVDEQVYLPFQSGRLPDEAALEQVHKGDAYRQALVDLTKKHPLRVFVYKSSTWVLDVLKRHRVTLTPDSGVLANSEFLNLAYKRTDYDLATRNFSVVGGDPDGIYHAMGKHGAIVAPVTKREKVEDLLERARLITDLSQLDTAYQEVSMAILEEVPYIHLGFSRSVVVINPNRVEIRTGVPRRNQGHLHIFKRK